jgi:hypothetical protein
MGGTLVWYKQAMATCSSFVARFIVSFRLVLHPPDPTQKNTIHNATTLPTLSFTTTTHLAFIWILHAPVCVSYRLFGEFVAARPHLGRGPDERETRRERCGGGMSSAPCRICTRGYARAAAVGVPSCVVLAESMSDMFPRGSKFSRAKQFDSNGSGEVASSVRCPSLLGQFVLHLSNNEIGATNSSQKQGRVEPPPRKEEVVRRTIVAWSFDCGCNDSVGHTDPFTVWSRPNNTPREMESFWKLSGPTIRLPTRRG